MNLQSKIAAWNTVHFIFWTSYVSGLLRLYEDVLLHMDFIHLAQYLTRLPDTISADGLFRSIELVSMVTEKRSFVQVLAASRELRELNVANGANACNNGS